MSFYKAQECALSQENQVTDALLAFKYLTEKIRVDQTQLTAEHMKACLFHLICTPARCINLVGGILNARKKLYANNVVNSRPLFIWEPVPDSCGPQELDNVFEALKYVDVVSPNHQELAALFFRTGKDECPDDARNDKMEQQCSELLTKGFGEKVGAVVVRCGEKGCYVATRERSTEMPPYHQSSDKVVDPTGAGNTFLGGFGIGMLEKPLEGFTAFESGAVYGSVAAGFAVEQVGLPYLQVRDGKELWNGEAVSERLEKYLACIDAQRSPS